MSKAIRFIVPCLILLVAYLVAKAMIANREVPEKSSKPVPIPLVETATIPAQPYAVQIRSRGVVQPRTESSLLPQVSGNIVRLGKHFRAGGFFEPGDLLIEIDSRDYVAAQTIAQAELTQAKLQLVEEQARSAQAKRDLQRLSLNQKSSDLALRKPQLASAQAAVNAATARLTRANLDLERTQIRAPYAGRVLEQTADVGQSVSPGTVLGKIYAVDYVEVRLPVTNEQLQQLTLPDEFRNADSQTRNQAATVKLTANIGTQSYHWQGQIVRSDGAIDSASRQTIVVAQVDDPYAANDDGRPPLKVGQFVEAEIQGRRLDRVWPVPRSALTTDGSIFTVSDDNRVKRMLPKLLWRSNNEVVVAATDDQAITVLVNPLPLTVPGMQVRTQADEGSKKEPRSKPEQAQ